MSAIRQEALIAAVAAYPRDGLGSTWPELRDQLLKLYRERVGKLAFVPMTWIDQVAAEHAAGNVLVLVPPFLPNGTVRPNLPAWLASNPQALAAWKEAAEVSRLIVFHYAAGKVTEGRAEMARAQANAAFWDGLYRAAVFVADAPANAVSGVLGGVQRVVGGVAGAFLKSPIVWVALVAGGGFLAWRLGLIKRKGK